MSIWWALGMLMGMFVFGLGCFVAGQMYEMRKSYKYYKDAKP